MRRVLVVVLIFLFPLEVFAGSLDRQLPLHANAADDLILSETAYGADDTAAPGVSSNWDASEELPAGADINDSLDQDSHHLQLACLSHARPQYTPPSHHLLFLPVAKPPPVI